MTWAARKSVTASLHWGDGAVVVNDHVAARGDLGVESLQCLHRRAVHVAVQAQPASTPPKGPGAARPSVAPGCRCARRRRPRPRRGQGEVTAGGTGRRPRTFSSTRTNALPSEKRITSARPRGRRRYSAISAPSALLADPAKISGSSTVGRIVPQGYSGSWEAAAPPTAI
jgi:hypothetical protein